MIVQDFHIMRYRWSVRAYYAVTTYRTDDILKDFSEAGCKGIQLKRAYNSLKRNALDTGITYSNFMRRETVMVISLTSSPAEFLNSWEHEKKHLARHIEQAYGIDPYSEEAAYLEGEIAQKMFPVASKFLCERCRSGLMKDECNHPSIAYSRNR